MIAPLTALLLALALPGGAVAQECAPLHTAALGLIESTGYRVLSPGDLTEGETCSVTGLAAEGPAAADLRIEVARIAWQQTGIDPSGPLGAAAALDLRVTGLRWYPQLGSDRLTYMTNMQTLRKLTDARLRMTWDPETAVLDIAELSLDLPGRDALTLSMRLSDLHVGVLILRGTSGFPVALDRLEIRLRNEGYFDSVYLGALVNMLGEDPAAAVAAFQARALATLETLPGAAFAPATKAALAALIADLPVPWGEMALTVTPAEPLTLMPFVRDLRGAQSGGGPLDALFAGVTVEFAYAPWDGWPE